MPETAAQRQAREANLRKGNPKAYRGAPQDGAPPPPRESKRSAQGASQEDPTFRARAAKAPARAAKPKRAARSRPAARAPAADPPPARGESKGFLGGLLEGLAGG